MKDVAYGLRKELPAVPYNAAVDRVSEALKAEGFGILTRIDVKSTLKEKLNVDYKPYVILGACNPELAHRALTADDSIGLLLPCNIVVTETEKGSEVSIARPEVMLAMADSPEVIPIAEEAESRLRRVLEEL